VKESYSNTFIAFGLQHNARMIQALGNANKHSSNWLIDKLENAGLVYGEILNNELYKVMTGIEIVVDGGFVYNYKTGEFVDKLYIGDLVTEVKKLYHLLSLDGSVEVSISGRTRSGCDYMSIASVTGQHDLTDQMFRLQTQQYMFSSKKFEIKHPYFGLGAPSPFPRMGAMRRQNALSSQLQIEIDEPVAEPAPTIEPDPVELFRKEMKSFMELLQKYMKDTGKENDLFLSGLCDDVYITIRSLGTRQQEMCVAVRETSQGRQQTYNVKEFDFDSMHTQEIPYMVSRTPTTAYQTPSALKMMRTCTGHRTDLNSELEEKCPWHE